MKTKKEIIEEVMNYMDKWFYFEDILLNELKEKHTASWQDMFCAKMFWKKVKNIDYDLATWKVTTCVSIHYDWKVYVVELD